MTARITVVPRSPSEEEAEYLRSLLSDFETETPEPLDHSAVTQFLGDRRDFDDCCADALLWPTTDPSTWEASANAIRVAMFAIYERRENGLDDSHQCRVLADILMRNLNHFVERNS